MGRQLTDNPIPVREESSNYGRSQVSNDGDVVEPIAVVGLSFGFPQDAISSDAFWELLMEKRNTATEFPPDRLGAAGIYHPDQNRRGHISVRKGHFMQEDIGAFDAPFFSISSSDASLMDPQQRKLLEYTYRALENAGLRLEDISGSKTSTYVGTFTNDWQQISFKDSETCGSTTALGTQPCVNANRISWFYNLKGNSANIDTACSSSLVALDLGCKDLRSGASTMSIIGGSNLIFSPDFMYSLSNMNMLSPDGQCYSFDHRAAGYGRGEGIGVLVLKRLSDALRSHDTIRAVIRNTGSNQDGRTPSITQPNGASQEALIKETYSAAGLSMFPTRFFEAHGTGTPVGDPTEATALGSAFSKTRTLQDPLIVGAVKGNIGHLEGGSGIAALVKTILILEKGVIPPNTNIEQVNPKIDTELLKIKFPLCSQPWPSKGLRRASVNSFGFAGTNAHVVLDDALHYLEERGLQGFHTTVQDPPVNIVPKPTSLPHSETALNGGSTCGRALTPKLLVFSGYDEKGLKRQIPEYSSYFSNLDISAGRFDGYLLDLAYTLDSRRSKFSWNCFAVVHTQDDLRRIDEIVSSPQKILPTPALGFVFTGQGAQWAGMGQELGIFPSFRESLEKAEEYLKEFGCPWRLRDELSRKTECSNINRPDLSQPLCTAIQVGLVDLLRSFNIRPNAVVGHSSGEIAAAYSIGAISAKSAMKISYFRGVVAASLANSSSEPVTMMSVGLSQEDIQPYIEDLGTNFGHSGLSIACINSPRNVTVSGDAKQINSLKSLLDQKEIFARRLLVDVAYHSPFMQQVADLYKGQIQGIEIGETASKSTTMISSLTGRKVTAEELRLPEYWVSNLVSPVRFSKALSHLISRSPQAMRKKLDLSHRNKISINMLLEIGPHSALQGPIRDMLSELRGGPIITYASVLVRKKSALLSTLNAIGEMKCMGFNIDLTNVHQPMTIGREQRMTLPDLPEYRFDHSRQYWYESRISKRFRTHQQCKLDLLGKPVPDWNELEPRWRNHLRVSEMPWMEDHVINGAMIYPGAGMLVMAIEAANQMADQSQAIVAYELKDIQFVSSVKVPQDSAGLETQFSLHLPGAVSSASEWSEFRLCTYENNSWREACRGCVRVQYATSPGLIDKGKEAREELRNSCDIEERMTRSCRPCPDIQQLYQTLQKSGFDLGPTYRRFSNGAVGDEQQGKGDVSIFEWPESEYPQPHIIHPATLDGILQVAVIGITNGGQELIPTIVPRSISYLWVNRTGLSSPGSTSVKTCTWKTAQDNRGFEFGYSVLDSEKSSRLMSIEAMKLMIVSARPAAYSTAQDQDRPRCFHVEYKADVGLINAAQGSGRCESGLEPFESAGHYLGNLIHQTPGLRVVEIDGTIEGTTHIWSYARFEQNRDVEPVVIQNCSYHYTNNSPIVDGAHDIFEQHPHVNFGHLDIQSDPIEQGFEAGLYDVLIAPNPCHRYDNARPILQHMQKLLKRGGRLLLYDAYGPIKDKSNPLANNLIWQEIVAQSGSSDFGLGQPHLASQDHQGLVILFNGNANVNIQTSNAKQIVIVMEPKSAVQIQSSSEIETLLKSRGVATIETVNLTEAARMQDKGEKIFIVLVETDEPLIYDLSSEVYLDLQEFVTTASDVLWIHSHGTASNSKPELSVVTGLARVLCNEYPDHRFTTLALESNGELTEPQLHSLLQVLEENHMSATLNHNEPEYLERNGILTIPRIVPDDVLSQELHIRSIPQKSDIKSVEDAPALKLQVGSPGLLDTLHFVKDEDISSVLGDNEIEIQTQCVGVNSRDCQIALGQFPGSSLGLECAGIVTRVGKNGDFVPGDRVLMATQGGFRTLSRGLIDTTCKIPEGTSFAEAAAIPVNFGTAWAVIHHMARAQEGETILIHSAAGGTGQACVQIARLAGATILTTVGSLDQKQLLIEEFEIPEDHIFDSRDTSFFHGVNRMTKGRGVDIVINSLTGDARVASWNCVAPYGRFVDLGKKYTSSDSKIPLSSIGKNAAFMGFDLSLWHKEKPLKAGNDLHTLVDLIHKGTLHPPRPLYVRSISEVEDVFRELSTGNLSGKFVLQISPQDKVPMTLDTTPGFSLDPNATYVIAGGLGGLGRSTARWMVDRNARNLVLLSRSGASGDTARIFVEELQALGVRVEAPPCDITDIQTMQQVLGRIQREMPPVRGCIQGSMVSRDALFQNMTFQDWRLGVACKAVGSWNLHQTLPTGMDFFVCFSSVSGIVGLRGQANYNVGNSYLDALARYRVEHGEKAVSLDLGALVDDGLLAENPDRLKRALTYGALYPITRPRFFGILDHYCNPALPILDARSCQVVIGITHGGSSALDGLDMSRQPMLRHMLHGEGTTGTGDELAKDDDSRTSFSNSSSLIEAGRVVIKALIDKLSVSLPALENQDLDDVTYKPIQSYGVDSLLAVELRNWIGKEFRADVAVFETQGASTFSSLGLLVASRSELGHSKWDLRRLGDG